VTRADRAVAWVKQVPFGVEFAQVELGADRLTAAGVAIGSRPAPYRLDYTLETDAGFVTSRLWVASRGQGWRRTLDLRRSSRGAWEAETVTEGDAPQAARASGPVSLVGALDCDLGLSPLTNTMPVLRHGLLAGGGPVELLMAWVSVPDLGVHQSGQRYTFLSRDGQRSVVRYEATDGPFTADISFDRRGLVLDYPGIGHRL
jgi:hypothetical protein